MVRTQLIFNNNTDESVHLQMFPCFAIAHLKALTSFDLLSLYITSIMGIMTLYACKTIDDFVCTIMLLSSKYLHETGMVDLYS